MVSTRPCEYRGAKRPTRCHGCSTPRFFVGDGRGFLAAPSEAPLAPDPVPSAGVRRFLAAVNNGGLQLHLFSKATTVDLQVK
jgi:hypothetical protein